jgi:hypothetical protein
MILEAVLRPLERGQPPKSLAVFLLKPATAQISLAASAISQQGQSNVKFPGRLK